MQTPTYEINGKIPSKAFQDKNDDLAMAILLAVYDACIHFAQPTRHKH